MRMLHLPVVLMFLEPNSLNSGLLYPYKNKVFYDFPLSFQVFKDNGHLRKSLQGIRQPNSRGNKMLIHQSIRYQRIH